MFMFEETLNGLIVVVLVFFIIVMGMLMFAKPPSDGPLEDPLVDIFCMDIKTGEFDWKYLPNLHHQGGDFYLEPTQRGETLFYRCEEPTREEE